MIIEILSKDIALSSRLVLPWPPAGSSSGGGAGRRPARAAPAPTQSAGRGEPVSASAFKIAKNGLSA